MSRDSDYVIDTLREQYQEIEFHKPDERITGRFGSNASPTDGAPDGQMWVHYADGRSDALVIIGDRMQDYSRTAGKRCQVGFSSGGDLVAFAPANDTTSAGANAQAKAAKEQTAVSPARNVTDSRVLAPPDGELGAYIERDDVIGWAGGFMSIDPADLPSGTGERGWIVWYYPDGATTPGYAVTTPVVRPNKTNQQLSEARDLTLPTGAKRIGAQTVYEGQTETTYDNTRFENLRDWLNPTGMVYTDTSGAADGDVLTWNSSTETWTPEPVPGGSGAGDYILFTHEEAANTNGGQATSGSRQTRRLNQKRADTGTDASILELAFTSGGSYEVVAGNTITGATSGATATVFDVVLTGGSWAGGDAAGTLWLNGQTGTFSAENLNVGANTNVATIAGDSTSGNFRFRLKTGTYRVDGSFEFYDTGEVRVWLYNVTDAGDEAGVYGHCAYTSSANPASIPVPMRGRFTIAANKTFRVDYRCSVTSSSTYGQGVLNNFGGNEIYATLELIKE